VVVMITLKYSDKIQISYCTLSRRKEENLIENHTSFPMV
jgi:hypothetical protein